MSTQNLQDVFKDFSKKKVLIIGDVMLDQYTFGTVTRISPEAPVPVVEKTHERFVLGGAANVANTIASLGATAILIGVVGKDYRKDLFIDLLQEKHIKSDLVTSVARPTTLKNRIMVGEFQQLLRFDDETTQPLSSEEEKKIIALVEKDLPKVDAVVLSDYAKGFFSQKLTTAIIKLAKKAKKPLLADIKPKNKDLFVGVDIIAPNLKEAQEMSNEKDTIKAGKILNTFFKTDIVITLGAEGMMVFPKNGAPKQIFPKKVKVFDVSGAGDTVMAVLSLGLASHLPLQEAADIANHAGGVVVQKPGTATLSLEELESEFQELRTAETVEIVPKLWGYEKWLENNDKYCCKLLVLNKGYQCSLHYHNEKDEMFYVSKGYVRLESDGKVSYMKEGNFTRILPGTKHRFRGMEDSVIIEVSTHHEESDSHRIEESRKAE